MRKEKRPSNMPSSFKGFFIAWIFICLGLLATVIYVAHHFISKYW